MTPIGQARLLADDSTVTIAGTLTTNLGALETGRSAFVQDASGGIGLYLAAAVVDALPAGTSIQVTGTLGTRYQQRVLRVAEADLVAGPAVALPAPVTTTTGALGESQEAHPRDGQRVRDRVRGRPVRRPRDRCR